MSAANMLSALSGLALFLYGMLMMSQNLEELAGGRLEQVLRRFTSRPLTGLLAGTVLTALVHSSSAVMVFLIGFVNAGVMGLEQAVWVIMGANIGTTVTSQLIALPIYETAPVCCMAGVLLQICSKKKKVKQLAGTAAGFGVLLIGMETMKLAAGPLQESEAAVQFMLRLQNPLAGILGGAAFTALIQSSTAAVAIVQALLANGVMELRTAAFLIFGQNIGTCMTSVLASLGACKNAKRAAFLHLLFNVAGTALFTLLCLGTPFLEWIQRLTPGNPAAQAANIHTIHNVVTALVLLPFGRQMTALSKRVIK